MFHPDTVSRFNVGRQLFYDSDVGLNKAECLVGRVNMAYGTRWRAVPHDYRKGTDYAGYGSGLRPDVIVTCTDTAKSRRDLHNLLWGGAWHSDECSYWLDCANLATVGQVVLGQPGNAKEGAWPRNREFDPGRALWKGQRKTQVRDQDGGYNRVVYEDKWHLRLPCVTELHPELMDEGFDEDDEPSCSMVDSERKQSLFVNRTVSAYALDLLWELIREGKVDNQGAYFNLRTRTAQAIPLKVWPVQARRRCSQVAHVRPP